MPLSRQEEFYVPEFNEEEVSIATTEFSTHSSLATTGDRLLSNSCQPNMSSSSVKRQGSSSSSCSRKVSSSSSKLPGNEEEAPPPQPSDDDLFVKPVIPVQGKGKGVGKKATKASADKKR